MDSIGSLHPLARTWLLDGPLSPYVDAFMALMKRGRYAEGTVTTDLRALAHFAHWMTRCRLAADQIDRIGGHEALGRRGEGQPGRRADQG